MIAQETIRELQNISVSERLYIMEILLNSLKQDIERQKQPCMKRFTARHFNLGQDINADRDSIYSERGFR